MLPAMVEAGHIGAMQPTVLHSTTAGSGTFGTAPAIGLEISGSCTNLFSEGNDGGDSVVGLQDSHCKRIPIRSPGS